MNATSFDLASMYTHSITPGPWGDFREEHLRLYEPPRVPPTGNFTTANGSSPEPREWSAFKKELLQLYKPPLRSRKTLAGMEHALRLLTELGIQTTADLTPDLIGRLVASRPATLSANTVRGTLRYVSAACSYAESQGFLRVSPFKIRSLASWKRPTPARGKKHASRAEIRVVLDYMKEKSLADGWIGWKAKRTYALTAVLAYTGVRAGEAEWLQVGDIDLDRGVIAIVSRAEHRLKTAGSEAHVIIPPALLPILREWLEHRMSAPPGFKLDDPNCPWLFPTTRRHKRAPWHTGGPSDRPASRIRVVAAQAGVPNFTPLTLRHSMATHLLHFGAGKGMIQKILRHSSVNTQSWYLHDDLDDMRAAVSNVEF